MDPVIDLGHGHFSRDPRRRPCGTRRRGSRPPLLAGARPYHYIQEGSKGAVIYDFIDPNCPYCHQIYTWLRNPIDNGGLRVRFIIVGFLTPSSAGKAAAILSAADPVQALQKNEVQFSVQRSGPQGGIAPASPQRVERMRGVLHFNKSLLEGKEFQLEGAPVISVPLLVYRQGNTIHYLSGLPDNAQWKALLDAS